MIVDIVNDGPAVNERHTYSIAYGVYLSSIIMITCEHIVSFHPGNELPGILGGDPKNVTFTGFISHPVRYHRKLRRGRSATGTRPEALFSSQIRTDKGYDER